MFIKDIFFKIYISVKTSIETNSSSNLSKFLFFAYNCVVCKVAGVHMTVWPEIQSEVTKNAISWTFCLHFAAIALPCQPRDTYIIMYNLTPDLCFPADLCWLATIWLFRDDYKLLDRICAKENICLYCVDMYIKHTEQPTFKQQQKV